MVKNVFLKKHFVWYIFLQPNIFDPPNKFPQQPKIYTQNLLTAQNQISSKKLWTPRNFDLQKGLQPNSFIPVPVPFPSPSPHIRRKKKEI